METDGQIHVDRSLPQGIEARIVIVELGARIAGHHHALEALILDFAEIRDRFLDRAHRRLTKAIDAIGSFADVGFQPAIVGLHAGVLVIGVLQVADQHADGGIDEFGGDAVLVHIGDTVFRIPAAAVQFGEPVTFDADVFRSLAGRCQRIQPDRIGEALDQIFVATAFLVIDDMRRAIAIGRVDEIDIAVRRLDNMRIRGNRRGGDIDRGNLAHFVHGYPLRVRTFMDDRKPPTRSASRMWRAPRLVNAKRRSEPDICKRSYSIAFAARSVLELAAMARDRHGS